MKYLHRNLRQLAEEAGGPEELAVKVEVSFWTVQSWLRANEPATPSSTNLYRLADAFKVTVDELLNSRL